MAKKEKQGKKLLYANGRPTEHGHEVLTLVMRQRVGNYRLDCVGGAKSEFTRNMHIVDRDADGSEKIRARFSSLWLADLVESHSFTQAAEALWTYVNSPDNAEDLRKMSE